MPEMFPTGAAPVNAPPRSRSTIAQYFARSAASPANGAGGRPWRPGAIASWLLARTVLPARCCLCGLRGDDPDLDLCALCRDGLPDARMPATSLQGTHHPELDRVEPHHLTPFKRVVVPFRYAYPVDYFVRALKFRGERVYARVLGRLLAEARLTVNAPLPELLVPVALHPSRYKERGFNQAHELARYAAQKLGMRVQSRCLARVVHTREQSALPVAERVENVRGAFALARPLSAERIALVDDVLTTGSTAAEAARVLTNAGAKEIELWVAARVPHH